MDRSATWPSDAKHSRVGYTIRETFLTSSLLGKPSKNWNRAGAVSTSLKESVFHSLGERAGKRTYCVHSLHHIGPLKLPSCGYTLYNKNCTIDCLRKSWLWASRLMLRFLFFNEEVVQWRQGEWLWWSCRAAWLLNFVCLMRPWAKMAT